MENQREMNFWDLCVAFGRLIGRGCQALWCIGRRMIRLTYHYWWLVLPILVLAIAAALYRSRPDNINRHVQAVALLNGVTIPQFEQAFAPLCSGKMLPPQSNLETIVNTQIASRFTTFRVVDCLHDGVADYVDFKRKSSPTDTTKVQMHDRLCIQFDIKDRNIHRLPEIEQEVLAFLNSNEALQQSYISYMPNLLKEAEFNHRQWNKLDSLTSAYYFNTRLGEESGVGNGVVFMGDKKVHLFLDQIYRQHKHTEQTDYRLQLAFAPVVLENHFAVNPKPLNGRNKSLVLFFLLGWIGACAIAEIIDKRKEIAAWLKA